MDRHLHFLTDINGNGLLDIVRFIDQHVFVTYNRGDGTFLPVKPILADFCYDNGWCISEHLWFIVDMTGDGKLNLVSFADDGGFVIFNNGDGTFQSAGKVLNEFCQNMGGWAAEKDPQVIADLTDMVAEIPLDLVKEINNGIGAFQASKTSTPGQADIVGFARREVNIAYHDGNVGFIPGSIC